MKIKVLLILVITHCFAFSDCEGWYESFSIFSNRVCGLFYGEYYQTRHFWDSKGKQRPAFEKFRKGTLGMYAEFRPNDCDWYGAYGAYDRVEETLNGNSGGFEDVLLSWRRQLYCRDNSHLGLNFIVIVPVGAAKPAIRYGRWGGELAMDFDHDFCFWSKPGWYQVQLGYRFYHGFPSDQIRAIFTTGLYLTPCLQLMLAGELDYGLFNGSHPVSESLIAYNANYRLFKIVAAGIWQFTNYGNFSLGYCQHLWGENVGTGGAVFGQVGIAF